MSAESKKLSFLYSNMQKSRENYESMWRDLVRFLLPDHGQFIDDGEQPDLKTNYSYIFSSVPNLALQLLAGGLQGMIPRERAWLRIGVADPDKNKFFKSYFDEVSARMLSILELSNFYSAMNFAHFELGGFGTSSLTVLEHPEKVCWFRPLTIGEYSIGEDRYKQINQIGRSFYQTAQNIVQIHDEKTGELPRYIKKAAELGSQEPYEVRQIVLPNENKSFVKIGKTNKNFSSYYLLPSSGGKDSKQMTILAQSGYNEFPSPTIRWSVKGSDVWGTGPGMLALNEIRKLYLEEEDKTNIFEHQANPAVNIHPDIKQQMDNDLIAAGAVFEYDAASGAGAAPVLPPGYFQVDGLLNDIPVLENRIKQVFFNDLLLMITDQPNVTAYQISKLVEQKGAMLGHILHRIETEFYDPIIDRVFEIANRKGLIPEPPPELSEDTIKPEYISMLFLDAKSGKRTEMEMMTQFAGLMAEQNPDIAQLIDSETTVREYLDTLSNAPGNMLVPSDIYNQTLAAQRAQANAQAQAAQQQEMLQGAVQGAETLSKTNTQDKNALTDLLNQAQAQGAQQA